MSCPGRLVLVRRALGELDADALSGVEEHVQTCVPCRRLAEEIDSNLETYAPQREAAFRRLAAQLSVPRRRLWLAWALAPGVAVAVALVLFALPTDDVSFKGAFAVKIVAMRDDEQFVVRDGQRLRQGDALRFVVTTEQAGFVSIVLVDAAGRVWPFYPDSEPTVSPEPWKISGKGRHELPDSIAMDASVGDEQLVVLFSPVSFSRERAHRRMAGLQAAGEPLTAAALGLEAGSVRVVHIHKGDQP